MTSPDPLSGCRPVSRRRAPPASFEMLALFSFLPDKACLLLATAITTCPLTILPPLMPPLSFLSCATQRVIERVDR